MDDSYAATARDAANVTHLRQRPRSEDQTPRQHPLTNDLIFFDNIEPVTVANDFVEGLLITHGMSVIYGEANSGKTFFATDLALHVACGWPWNGREITRGAVLYCALEGAHGITNRVAAFKQYHAITSLPFAILPVAVDMLNSGADVAGVLQAIEKIEQTTGLAVSLTVIDTLSRAMAGGNENSPDDMGEIVRNGTRIQQQGNTHVAWVHHTGKDDSKGARGHSLLRAATDTEIEILAEGSSHTARVTKQRDLECSGEFHFGLKVVELGTNHRGKPITSCIVDYGSDSPAVERNAKLGGGQKARALEILQDIIGSSGASGYAGTPPNLLSVPEAWWRDQFYARSMPGADQAARQKAFRRAADELVNTHRVGINNQRVWLVARTNG